MAQSGPWQSGRSRGWDGWAGYSGGTWHSDCSRGPSIAMMPGAPNPDDPVVTDLGDHSSCPSIVGDSIADGSGADTDQSETAVAARVARRAARVAPIRPEQGDPNIRRQSSRWNAEPEVGNFGLFFGNWGLRATLAGAAVKKMRRKIQDRQIMKCPAQVLVLAETTEDTEVLLQQTRSHGNPDATGLDKRDTAEHWVQRGNEAEAILIAARKDVTTHLDCLEYDVYPDHPYTRKGRGKAATSRIMVCKVWFKQNIGHIGKEIVVAGVHGHRRTMKFEWPEALSRFWDRLASKIRSHGVHFIAGDFNMAFTEVVKQLRSRGLTADCCAWYLWRHDTMKVHDQALGLDSCGIFYIGGMVQVSLPWNLAHIDTLTAVGEELETTTLDVYGGQNHPGQHWSAFRSKKFKEADADKCLRARLTDLLTPSTAVADLEGLPKRPGVHYCPYLRLKQRPLDKNEWLVNDGYHNGAHFPLCVFTNNARARSAEKALERAVKYKGKAKGGKGKTQWKGEKGKGDIGKSAVAEDASSTWGHSGNAWSWSSKPGWSSSWNSQWSWSYRPEWSGWSWHDGRSWSQDNDVALPWNSQWGDVWVRLKL